MVSASAYLRHVGLPEDLEPTHESLQAIQRAHLEQVPYNNLEIMLGAPPPVEGAEALGRLLSTGRSGYCFHQNGALELVLRELGFSVEQRHGHVWTQPEHQHQEELNHLVLLVRGLPTAANPDGWWWPDVGLGNGVRDPIPVVTGRVSHPPFSFELSRLSTEGWSFRNDPRGSFTGVEISRRPSGPAAVLAAHEQLSSPPHGAFTRLLVVARRDRRASHVLKGCVLRTISDRGADAADVTTYDEWLDALTHLRLPFSDLDPEGLRDLFTRTLSAHRAWDDAGRP